MVGRGNDRNVAYFYVYQRYSRREDLKMKSNIVLIGMPGVGKSTIGVILAKIIGYYFLDSDLVIQETYRRYCQRLWKPLTYLQIPAASAKGSNPVLTEVW